MAASFEESVQSTTSPALDPKERFYRYFQEEATALQEQMQQLEHVGLVGGERQDAIDHCSSGIARLSNEVADASSYVAAYDQRMYSQAVKALNELLQEKRNKIAPRPKFSFRTSQKNGSAISLTDAAELAKTQRLKPPTVSGFTTSNESSIAPTPVHLLTPPPGEVEKKAPDEVNEKKEDTLSDLPSFPNKKDYNEELSRPKDGTIRKPSFSEAKTIQIMDHSGLHIILPSSASHATSSGSLSKLTRCVVDMTVPTVNGAPFAGLMLKNISKSLIVAGHVAGAAHITGVENSTILVAARQVRMHECKNVDIYLFASGRPIIEDCSNVRFAPIPDSYLTKLEGLPGKNQWDQVDDFKWLKQEPSPHWSILPAEDRLKESVWTDVVPGGPSLSVDGILSACGVPVRW